MCFSGARGNEGHINGSYETIPDNSGIHQFIWELCSATHRILERVKAYGGTFNGKKSFIATPDAVVVGHSCTYHGHIPDSSQVQKIISWPTPTSLTEVWAFLGSVGVLHIFIRNFTTIARPLVVLTKKDVEFKFLADEQESMDLLKEAVVQSPALRPIDYTSDRTIVLAVDSCPIQVSL
jgi:hypothetical protein